MRCACGPHPVVCLWKKQPNVETSRPTLLFFFPSSLSSAQTEKTLTGFTFCLGAGGVQEARTDFFFFFPLCSKIRTQLEEAETEHKWRLVDKASTAPLFLFLFSFGPNCLKASLPVYVALAGASLIKPAFPFSSFKSQFASRVFSEGTSCCDDVTTPGPTVMGLVMSCAVARHGRRR